jgi:hypothetical protein
MPYHWLVILSSPPRERRDEVREICRRHGGRLCENQIYYDEAGQAHALVQLPADAGRQQALLTELGATGWTGLVDADEQEEDVRPPHSRRGA